jgi:hypothetical protein
MEFKVLPVIFSYRYIRVSCTPDSCFTYVRFCNQAHLEDTGSLRYADLSNAFHDTV